MSDCKEFDTLPDDDLNKVSLKYLKGASGLRVFKGTVMYKAFLDNLADVHNFKIKDDDVVVCSFPKSGTTWLQEMVWCIANDLNFEDAKTIDLDKRFPYFEYSCLMTKERLQQFGEMPAHLSDSLGHIRSMVGRRFIKTHLPLPFLPNELRAEDRKAKLLYVCRDPRDVCVSHFHHPKMFSGNFHDFFKLFVGDRLAFGPYWSHVLPYWNNRSQPNLLFLTYEEMKTDLPSVIRRVADFLEKSLTGDQVAALAEHISLESMRNNKAVNGDLKEDSKMNTSFVRAGQSGGYKKEMTADQMQVIDDWAKKNIEGTDFVVPAMKP